MNLKPFTRAPILIAAGIIGLVCLVQIIRFSQIERLEWMTYDLRVREAIKHPVTTATNLGFVDISDKSIEALNDGSLGKGFTYGLYWPRHIYGRVARELTIEGAKVVAFDVLFGDLRPDHAAVPISDQMALGSDEYFGRLMGKMSNVVLAAERGTVPPPLFRTNALTLGDISADRDADGILRRAKAFQTYHKWHRAFQQLEDDPDYGVNLSKAVIEPKRIILPRAGAAPIIFPIDADGRFDLADFAGDKIPPGVERHPKAFTEDRIWHMGIVLAARELKLDLDNASVELNKGRIILRGPGGVARTIPVDARGYFYINWRLKVNDPHLTESAFEHLLQKDLQRLRGETNGLANEWQGKLAIIGSSTTGNDLTDHGATPLEENTYLVSKHWNVANSILTNHFIRRAGLPVELLLICLLGATAVFLNSKRRPLVASIWILVAMTGYVALTFAVFIWFGYWLPMVLPLLGGLLVTHACLLTYLVVFEQAERRRVRSVFTKIVSPNVVNELLKTEKLPLDGALRNISVLFADIRGFTEMTDVNREKAAEHVKQFSLVGEAAEACFETQARETLDTVNLYLSTIAEQVILNDGTIDKFIGDCVMAFWGAPIPNQQHALCCVRAAISAQRAVYTLNRKREAENLLREAENVKRAEAGQPLLPLHAILSVGSGINTGVVTVGLMGSDSHFLNYTVFGRDVNLASRLETVSGRGRIIISEATLAEIIQDDPDLALSCAELPPVTVKGIRTAVRIYEVPWRTGEYAAPAPEAAPSAAMSGYDTIHITGTSQPSA